MTTPPSRFGRIFIFLSLITTLAAASLGLAKEPSVAVEPPPSPWDISFTAGIGLTDGNSDTLDLLAGFSADYITDDHELYLGAAFAYSELESVTTNESLRAYAQYNRLLNDRFYLGVFGDFLYDPIGAVDYRFTVGPTLGYYLIKNDRTRLALEAGGGYIWEDVGSVKSEYWTLRFAQRLTHQLTDTLSLFQSAAFLPEAGDWDNFLFYAEAGIETRMSDRLSLRVFVNDRYDNRPADGSRKNDLGVYTALSIAVGPVAPVENSSKGGIAATPESDWDVSLSAGGSYTNGNSDTLAISADLIAERLTDLDEIYLGVGGAYGESDNVRNQESVFAFGQYNKLLSERVYAGGRTDFLYDDIAALDYRVTPSVLLGYYLIKNDTTRLAIDAGPSFTWEDQSGIKNEYFGVLFGQRFSHKINDRLELWQSARLLLDTENTDNYVVDAQAGFDIKIGEKLGLRTAVQNIYDGETPVDIEKNDFRLTSGLVFTF